jgi:hypothetical protein
MIPVLLILGLVIVSLILVLGIAIGVGWILTLILPFTLFEGALLVMLASVIVGIIGSNLVRSLSDSAWDLTDDDYDEGEDDRGGIPASRFFKTSADGTWEAWFRYEIANDIYGEFLVSPTQIAPMDDRQLQELAIRLADTAVAILKARKPRVRRVEITQAMLAREMTKAGQQPYDDDILGMAVTAISMNLDYYQEDLIRIIRDKSWDEPTSMFSLG